MRARRARPSCIGVTKHASQRWASPTHENSMGCELVWQRAITAKKGARSRRRAGRSEATSFRFGFLLAGSTAETQPIQNDRKREGEKNSADQTEEHGDGSRIGAL